MKKIFKIVICICISLFCVFGMYACGENKNKNAVNLVAIDADSVGLRNDIDYYVVAEPAASAKVKAVQGLNFVGDLQKLYGGENGYPQAVVVAKHDLFGSTMLDAVTNALAQSYDWLTSDATSIETIVNAIQSNLTAGLEPSIKTQNLTKSVIKNCGIKFVSAADSKADIVAFMEKLNSVSDSSFGTPSEDFFDNVPSGWNTRKISVYAPDGAPALGLASLMAENVLGDMAEYHIVKAETIQTVVKGAELKADICVLPVNLAVKLLGNAEKYRLLGTLTHGNLYMLSKDNKQITIDNLEELKGKTVGVVNLAAVPGLIFKLILNSYGIEYTEPYND
ncbi:MAG: hypothetical protein K2N23_07200 [Clostridia bacterium]|nr:hypothetical protein [Clostridia bacterium]